MSKENNLQDFLTDVANAIREKKGTTEPINVQDFSAEIASIETGGASDMPVIGDGKTYLYIKIAAEGRMNVTLRFSQTVANGVTIDWGDGSATQTLSGTGAKSTTHTYAEIGEYRISLNPTSGCTLGFSSGSSSYCVMGSISNANKVYCNMLQAVEIGRNVTSISAYAFQYCHSLSSVVIQEGVTSIGDYAFHNCYSLSSIVIPGSVKKSTFRECHSLSSVVIQEGVTSIGDLAFYYCYSLSNIVIPYSVTSIGSNAFYYCYSLSSIVIPGSVTSIGDNAFHNCYGMAFYDFSQCTSVPTLGASVFLGIPSGCKIVVPDSLYSTWTAATNWSTYASQMVKASEFKS